MNSAFMRRMANAERSTEESFMRRWVWRVTTKSVATKPPQITIRSTVPPMQLCCSCLPLEIMWAVAGAVGGAAVWAPGDKIGRHKAAANNYSFYGAPHAALLFMPSFGDNVRVGGDIGMYGQTFLLSLTARGLGGIPQTAIGFFAQTIREYLGISDELKLMFAIAFGYPDFTAPVNSVRMGRVPVSESVTFHH